MAFVDSVTIEARAGKGGDGVTRWLRTKETARGPAGGDGGRGGDVILLGVHDLAVLAAYRFEKEFAAEAGAAGENQNKHGKDGKPVVIRVPVGTVATVAETGEAREVTKEGEELVLFRGGAGGLGNTHFKGSTNQNPFTHTKGKPGEAGTVTLTLKLIADAGLIGFPNAGKSSLLNALTRAQSKVGAYPFTTLEPHLGVLYGRILADIPGLIEGASEGRGLGSAFLQHIERTRILVHLVSAERDDPVAAYRAIRNELDAFGRGLPEKPEILVLSKTDLLSEEEARERVATLRDYAKKDVLSVSALDEESLKTFSDMLLKTLRED